MEEMKKIIHQETDKCNDLKIIALVYCIFQSKKGDEEKLVEKIMGDK